MFTEDADLVCNSLEPQKHDFTNNRIKEHNWSLWHFCLKTMILLLMTLVTLRFCPMKVYANDQGFNVVSVANANDTEMPAPRFREGRSFGQLNSTEALAFGDVNADGSLDIVEGVGRKIFFTDDPGGSSYQRNLIHLNKNDGSGTYHDAIPFGYADDTTSLLLGDLNNDGALDLVVGNNNGSNLVYLNKNDGSGSFVEGTSLGKSDGTTSVALGDLNGDGALDLVVGNGGERFIDVTDLIYTDKNGESAVDCSDIGDPVGEQNTIYLNKNDGSGAFHDPIPLDAADKTTSVALGDLNGDGALDLVVGNGSVYPYAGGIIQSCYQTDQEGNFITDYPAHPHNENNRIYINRNDGTGTFEEPILLDALDATTSIVLGDLNSDGALDLVVGNGGLRFMSDYFVPDLGLEVLGVLLVGEQNYIYLNKADQSGTFQAPISMYWYDPTTGVALGDVNGDGTLDIAVGNNGRTAGARSLIWLNFFQKGSLQPFDAGGQGITTSNALADVNSDGSLDLIVGNNGENAIYTNHGQIGFSYSTALMNARSDNNRTASLVLGDVNGDGALDLVAGSGGEGTFTATGILPGQRNVIYLNNNDGSGSFKDGVLFGDEDRTTSVALADLDGDTALDVVVGNTELDSGAYNLVYFNNNDGSGTFRQPIRLSRQDSTRSVAIGDMNEDGALDIVVGNDGRGLGEANLLYLNANDGSGAFGDPIELGGSDRTSSVVTGDFNGDGALDIFVGNEDGDDDLILLNKGEGSGIFYEPKPLGSADSTKERGCGRCKQRRRSRSRSCE